MLYIQTNSKINDYLAFLFFIMYRRTYYRGRSAKYSNETVCINATSTGIVSAGATFPQNADPDPEQGQVPKGLLIVPATGLMGNRKVKNFTLKIGARGNESPIIGALVYCPEGTLPSNLSTQLASQSLYEPNQNVIMTFIIQPSCDRDAEGYVTTMFTPPSVTVSNRLARNLSSGDSVVLVMCAVDDINAGDGSRRDSSDPTSPSKDPLTITGTLNFAIKY